MLTRQRIINYTAPQLVERPIAGKRSRSGIALDLAMADQWLRAKAAGACHADATYDRGTLVPMLAGAAQRKLARLARLAQVAAKAPGAPLQALALPRAIQRTLAGIGGGHLAVKVAAVRLHLDGTWTVDAQPQERAPMPMRGAHIAPASVPEAATHASVEAEARACAERLRGGIHLDGTIHLREIGT